MKYRIVVEKTETGFSAYSPDVPGCVTTGATKEETEENMKEAVAFHVEGLRQEGLSVPLRDGDSRRSRFSKKKADIRTI